jgi:hypothetical protein
MGRFSYLPAAKPCQEPRKHYDSLVQRGIDDAFSFIPGYAFFERIAFTCLRDLSFKNCWYSSDSTG